jgi:hypothetical protein
MRNDHSAAEIGSDPAAAKKLWTPPALDTYPAGSAENQPFSPNRGDGVTSCGS